MRKLALALLVLTLTACGSAQTTTGTDSTGASSPASSDVTLPEPVPSQAPSSGGAIGGDASSGDQVERQALAALQTQFKLDTSGFKLVNKEQVEWNDGSLGCAAPDMMYTQVITPGYKLTYSDGSQTYELHTNNDASQVVWCKNGKPQTTP